MYEIGSDTWPGMAKVVEEAGEVLQVIAKIMSMHGGDSAGAVLYWDGSDLKERLRDELADLEAAIWFFKTMNQEVMVIDQQYYSRVRRKQDVFMMWHTDQQSMLHRGIPLPKTVHPRELD